jgi:phage terminase small subunit
LDIPIKKGRTDGTWPHPQADRAQGAAGQPRQAPAQRARAAARAHDPAAPRWLVGQAAKVWDDYADLLHKNGVLTEAGGMAFAMLCKSFER